MTAPLGQELPTLPPRADVSVVIPARESAATLERAVRSALTQDLDGNIEVVIAVGPSNDRTSATAEGMAEQDGRVRVVRNDPGSTPAALNRAIDASRHEVVLRLDAHAELPEGYAQRAVELLRETGAANVGGRQVPVASGGFAAGVAAAMRSPAGAGGAAYRTGTRPADVDTVYLGVFRRSALEAVGGFDERLLRNQDYELNQRLRAAGWRVHFHPDLAVAYQPRRTVHALARQYYEYGRWKRATSKLHPGTLRLRQLAPPALVVALPASTGVAALVAPKWVAALPGVGYLVGVAIAAGFASHRPAEAPRTILALLVMHTSWGTGFLRGGVRLALCDQHGATSANQMSTSRASSRPKKA
jgi:succinoglycan biosynthesis protein ExoA